MKAYVAKNRSGRITKGWLLRRGTSINSCMCRPPGTLAEEERVEEVPVEVAVRGAAQGPSHRPVKRLVVRNHRPRGNEPQRAKVPG